jgi:hypothetical protein
MAFNNLGPPVFIWNSAEVQIGMSATDGSDLGAQWIMADPLVDQNQPNGSLMVKDFTKVKEPIYGVSFDGPSGEFEGILVSYWVTVRNDAGYAQWFVLQGGGNT